jgi:hypothetical protein
MKYRVCFLIITSLFLHQANAAASKTTGRRRVREQGATPGPLFGFGQNIIDKGQFITASYFEQTGGLDILAFEFDPFVLYGITDRASFLVEFNVPWTIMPGVSSFGISNLFLQGEYALYYKHDEDYGNAYNMWTIVGNIAPPVAKDDTVGRQTMSFFLGTTTSHNSERWYAYASTGVFFSLRRKDHYQYGSYLAYEFGLGFPLITATHAFLSLIFEMNGRYQHPDTLRGVTVPDTGFNRIFFGPIIYFWYHGLTIEAGFQNSITARAFGQQPLADTRIGLYIAYAPGHRHSKQD